METTLNKGELQLLDWLVTPPMPSLADMEYLLKWYMGWRQFRVRVWAALHPLKDQTDKAPFWFDEEEVEVLFCLCPTSFRWGTGEDVGYSLKTKLYKLIAGVDDSDNQGASYENSTSGEPKDRTESSA